MTVSVHAVAAALRNDRPGLGSSRLTSLLYFCQGHHLADSAEPLFIEPLYADRDGASIDDLGASPAAEPLTNGQLNTVGYVLSRYGNLSSADLRTLICAADPWQFAAARPDPRIELAWMRDWFRRAGGRREPDEPFLSREQIADLSARAAAPSSGPEKLDNRDAIVARIEAAKARVARGT